MITRFALLRHDVPHDFGRPSHWDLLLEREEVCWAWALEVLPRRLLTAEGPETADALRLTDHRKHYLDYEGPVNGHRGSVRRELSGRCEWLEESDSSVRVKLETATGSVELRLQQIDRDCWQLSAR